MAPPLPDIHQLDERLGRIEHNLEKSVSQVAHNLVYDLERRSALILDKLYAHAERLRQLENPDAPISRPHPTPGHDDILLNLHKLAADSHTRLNFLEEGIGRLKNQLAEHIRTQNP